METINCVRTEQQYFSQFMHLDMCELLLEEIRMCVKYPFTIEEYNGTLKWGQVHPRFIFKLSTMAIVRTRMDWEMIVEWFKEQFEVLDVDTYWFIIFAKKETE